MTEKTYPVQQDQIANGGAGVSACDKNIGDIVISLIFLIVLVWLTGCAPLPSLEEEAGKAVGEISAQSMAKAERDSIIAVRRSFAYERWKNGDYETARTHFSTIRQYDIDHEQNIYRSWADCFVRSDMIDSALFAYEEGIKYFPADDYLRSSLSIIYKNSGRFKEAIEQMVEAVKIRTASSLMKSSEFKEQLEVLKLQMKPLKLELDSLKQLLQSGADNAETIVKDMGELTRKIAEAAEPIARLTEEMMTVTIDDKMVEYLWALSELHETVEDWDMAIETYEDLSELLPDDPLPNQRKIDIIRMYCNPEEYLNSMKEAVEQFPDDPTRRFDYGVALLDQGYSEQAVAEFEICCEQKPDDPEGWRNLAAARDNLNDYHGAINALKKVIDLEPESLVDLVAIGENYINLKNWVEARRWAKKTLAKDGGLGSAWLLMGDIYYRAADLASGDSPKYDDKLVFIIAYGLYKRAAGSDDPEAISDGKRGMNILKGSMLLPSREERFMHRDKTRPSGKAYSWIKHDWSEVGYIDNFLKTLD
ncbi:hypothetical protein HQ587_02680 [bacterium]|nr:hypothetical protein [bacterium]